MRTSFKLQLRTEVQSDTRTDKHGQNLICHRSFDTILTRTHAHILTHARTLTTLVYRQADHTCRFGFLTGLDL